MFDDIGAPLLDVSAAGVREAAVGAECCFLMENGDDPIGVAIAHPDETGSEAELLALWVHPEHVGEGVTEDLLSRIAEELADHGLDTLRASVPDDRPSAREFYRAHGFSRRAMRRGPAGDEAVVAVDIDAIR